MPDSWQLSSLKLAADLLELPSTPTGRQQLQQGQCLIYVTQAQMGADKQCCALELTQRHKHSTCQ